MMSFKEKQISCENTLKLRLLFHDAHLSGPDTWCFVLYVEVRRCWGVMV